MTGRHAAAAGPEPEGLREAVLAYEAALMADDVAGLDDWFEPGTGTLRGDANGLLVGHEAIAAFRRARGGAPHRELARVELRGLADDLGVAVLVTDPDAGGHGLLTQVWRRTDGRWRVVAAQVAGPAPAIDGRVWRVAGAPLVPAPASGAEGPLAGRSVAVKDLFAIAGFAIGAGNPAWLAEAPIETVTAASVQRLLDAGARIAGIARTDEFAYAIAGVNAHYGAPPNPEVVGGIPGGSSSGPASAVALGQADIGLGTDTGGSIRVPASYQGLWGLRTTHDAVDRAGLLPLAPRFDTIGWLTRDAATLRAALVATLGEGDGEGGAPASGGLVLAPRLTAMADDAVVAAFGEATRALGAVDDVDLGDPDALFEAFRVVQAAEAWASDGPWLEAHPGAVSGAVAERFAVASRITPEQTAAAREVLAATAERLDDALGDRVLLLPSASSAAPQLGSDLEAARAATMRLTCVAGITGRPGLSIPVLRTDAGPVGLGLVGPRGSDLALVELGARLARQLGSSGHLAETRAR